MCNVENNPVQASLVRTAQEYPWSSASAHMKGTEDSLLSACYLVEDIKDWRGYLREGRESSDYKKDVERHLTTGRPMGSAEFILKLESVTKRKLKMKVRGRPVIAKLNFVKN